MWLKTKPTNLLRNVMPRPLADIASLCAISEMQDFAITTADTWPGELMSANCGR